MNGIHDLGGMHGFGQVNAEPEAIEPLFHAEWEKPVGAMTMMLIQQGRWSLDRFRQTIESETPIEYLSRSYFERWLAAIESLVVEYGMVTPQELATGRVASGPPEPSAPAWSPVFETAEPPQYAIGDQVRAVNRHSAGHTRLPRYARGRAGVIVGLGGVEPLPELAAEGICRPQHLYRVRFEASELWGPDYPARDAVYLELWDDYLEPVS
jgi:nitrile hydratase